MPWAWTTGPSVRSKDGSPLRVHRLHRSARAVCPVVYFSPVDASEPFPALPGDCATRNHRRATSRAGLGRVPTREPRGDRSAARPRRSSPPGHLHPRPRKPGSTGTPATSTAGSAAAGGEVTLVLEPLPARPVIAVFGIGHVGLRTGQNPVPAGDPAAPGRLPRRRSSTNSGSPTSPMAPCTTRCSAMARTFALVTPADVAGVWVRGRQVHPVIRVGPSGLGGDQPEPPLPAVP